MNYPQLSPPTGQSELVGDEPFTSHTPTTSHPNSRSAFRPGSQSNLSPFQYLTPPTSPTGNSFGPARSILWPRISRSNHFPGEADSSVLISLGAVANASPLVPRRILSEFIGYESLSPPNARDAYRLSSLTYPQPIRNRAPSDVAFAGRSFGPANSILGPRISSRRLLLDEISDSTVLSGSRVPANASQRVPTRGIFDLVRDESIPSPNARHGFRQSSLSNRRSFRNRSTSAAPRRSSDRPPYFNIRPRIGRRVHSPSGNNSSGQLMPSLNVDADTFSPVSTALPSFP